MFSLFFFLLILPIAYRNHQSIISSHLRQGFFEFKQQHPDMHIHFRNTCKDFPHQGLAETCLLRFARCPEALPNIAQPSVQRDLRDRGEDGAGRRAVQHNPHPPASPPPCPAARRPRSATGPPHGASQAAAAGAGSAAPHGGAGAGRALPWPRGGRCSPPGNRSTAPFPSCAAQPCRAGPATVLLRGQPPAQLHARAGCALRGSTAVARAILPLSDLRRSAVDSPG